MLTLVTMLLSVCVHEYAHALAAYKLGDDYAAREGRLTLNPMAHADPIGTLLFPAMAAFAGWGGFGWGRPVPYIPTNLTRRYSMRAGEAIVAFAGPLANLVMGVVCAGLWVGLLRYGVIDFNSPFALLLGTMFPLNFVLFFFNLLPVPPLDGSKIFSWLVGQRADRLLDSIASAGPIALIAVVLLGGKLIAPMVHALSSWVTLGFAALLT
jgi:Zn-dependent protease